MKEKTTLYHVNTHENIDVVFSKKRLLISTHYADKKYAGYGMYFWDNQGNAKYWFEQKSKHSKKSQLGLLVVSVEYSSDDLLDLMNLEQERYYSDIINKMNQSGQFEGGTLGDKIDFLCEVLEYKLARVSVQYPKTPRTGFLSGSYVTNESKIIYCIKEPHYDIIKEKQKEVFS